MKRKAKRGGLSAAGLCAAVCIALLAAPAIASADLDVCLAGTGAGQCDDPEGLAVDSATGELFVADSRNARIQVFDSEGAFERAFGWGVADGSFELQSCEGPCLAGRIGGGAGQLSRPGAVAVDSSSHDVYVFDSLRVQRFGPGGEFKGAWGGGVISGGAGGSADLSEGSKTIEDVKTTSKSFQVAQTIEGAGIPAGTKIEAVGNGTITLTAPATASGEDIAISAPVGAGNEAVNEVQELEHITPGTYRLSFTIPAPSNQSCQTDPISPTATAALVQERLEALPCIGAGNVSVTGPAGGPYEIEFGGARFADTNVNQLGESGIGRRQITTPTNGASKAETCTTAAPEDCSGGVAGTGEGQFSQSESAIATGPGGLVYVSDEGRVQKFEPSGALVEAIALAPAGLDRTAALAVDSSGDFYAIRGGGGERAVRKYGASGALLSAFHFDVAITALGIDAADNLYVGVGITGFNIGGTAGAIHVYDPAGEPLTTVYGPQLRTVSGLAPHTSPSGDVYATEVGTDRVLHIPFPDPGPVIHPFPGATESPVVGNTQATLTTRINPEGKATDYVFEYVDEAAYEKDKEEGGDGFEGPETAETAPTEVPIDPGAEFPLYDLYQVSAQVGCPDPEDEFAEGKCLVPETTYHFRAKATNADAERIGPEGAPFTTSDPLEIVDSWSSEVGTTEARLSASVNPLNIPAIGHFEYVEEETFEKDKEEGGDGFTEAIETPEVDFGSSEEPTVASAQLTSLQPDTAYRYRVVVSDFFVEGLPGPERRLVTYPPAPPPKSDCPNQAFRVGPGARLPDCRAYERVSPAEKNGGDILVPPGIEVYDLYPRGNIPARREQATPDGAGLAYSSATSFGGGASAPFASQYVARRDAAAGWQTANLNPPRGDVSLYTNAGKDLLFHGFSADLCHAWFIEDTGLELAPGAVAGMPNLYRRTNPGPGCGPVPAYRPLTTTEPPGFPETGFVEYWPVTAGHSADGERTVFAANGKLTAEGSDALSGSPATPVIQLYLAGPGGLSLLSELPGGGAADTDSSAGSADTNESTHPNHPKASLYRAVNEDASRVFWSTADRLYLRLDAGGPGAETIDVSKTVADAAASFIQADPQGTRALFTINSGPQAGLYSFEVATGTPTQIAAGVGGVLGASEDLSRVYFVSEQALGADLNSEGDAPVAGEANLYLHRDGEPVEFVATLPEFGTGTDSTPDQQIASRSPLERLSRVAPDGQSAAFMSWSAPTGHDNADAASGLPAAEVFLYDAAANGGDGELLCASCNPSGARPAARQVVEPWGGIPDGVYAAAQIPGWPSQLQPSRPLSADGSRLFFESFDALLPADTNEFADVYQWQRAAGETQCLEDQGGELFLPDSGGCLSLISSGEGASDARFIDASADGSDVFFTTGQRLIAADADSLVDIYDARAGGGFPAPPPPPATCEGEECRGDSPDAPDVQGAGSEAFQGQGNVTPDRCAPLARRARALLRGAKKLRRRAVRVNRTTRRARNPRRVRVLRRKARRLSTAGKKRARSARKQRNRTRRCRTPGSPGGAAR